MEVADATKDQDLNVTHCSGRVRGFSARARATTFQLRSVCSRDKLGSIACWT